MNTFEQMIERGHERVCFHQDSGSGLRAIVAIHSTRLGNALGGTRRWHYATEADALYDVLRLSEGMTLKAAGAGLPMGGAKSVVLLPRPGHPATEAEARAMGRFVETLGGAYIAAEDVGVDPQYIEWMALETRHVQGAPNESSGGDPSPYTARGVINATRAALRYLGLPASFEGLTVAVQGVGHVGLHLARMLAEQGARLIVSDIVAQRAERTRKDLGARVASPEEILFTECDILAPCALGGVIDASVARRLRCRILAPAANNVLDDPDEDAATLRSLGVLYVPDYIANAGGLIHLAGLYLGMGQEERDRKIAEIETTTSQVLRDAESMSSTHAAAGALVSRRLSEGGARRERIHAG
jgi:leucine dehydrogenase